MTKSEAKNKFIKDLITLLIGFIIGGIVGLCAMPADDIGSKIMSFIIFGLFLGGIPLGWKFASHIITAVSFIGIIGKLFISLVLGWIVAPITVIKDIVSFVVASKNDTSIDN